jgi:hypothetical protein
VEARLRQSRHEEIGPGQAPDDLPFHAGGDARREEGRRRSVDGARSAACEFMQSAVGEAPSRKHGVDVW